MASRSDLLFDAAMSIKYHRRRGTFLERASGLISACILLSGAGAFASVVGDQSELAKLLTLFVAVMGIIQIVFHTDQCAAEHKGWLRRWTELLKEIERTPSPSPQQLQRWNDTKLDIEGECVGEMRALQEDCYNRTMAALNLQGMPTRLRWWHRLFMQVYSFENGFQGT